MFFLTMILIARCDLWSETNEWSIWQNRMKSLFVIDKQINKLISWRIFEERTLSGALTLPPNNIKKTNSDDKSIVIKCGLSCLSPRVHLLFLVGSSDGCMYVANVRVVVWLKPKSYKYRTWHNQAFFPRSIYPSSVPWETGPTLMLEERGWGFKCQPDIQLSDSQFYNRN